jgi:hypothetical protein
VYTDTASFPHELIDLAFVSTDVCVDEDAWSPYNLKWQHTEKQYQYPSHDDANEATMTGIILRFFSMSGTLNNFISLLKLYTWTWACPESQCSVTDHMFPIVLNNTEVYTSVVAWQCEHICAFYVKILNKLLAYSTFVTLYLWINQIGNRNQCCWHSWDHVKYYAMWHIYMILTWEKKCAMCVAKCFKVMSQLL